MKMRNLYQKTLDPNRICTTTCNLKGSPKGDTIRCCLCGHWFHESCLKLSSDDISGVWPCYTCRSIHSDIVDLQSTVSSLITMNTTLMNLLEKQQKQLDEVREGQIRQSDVLNHIGDNVKELRASIVPEISFDDENLEAESVTCNDPASGHLLIGDSLLRNLVVTSDDLTISTHGGARFNDITARLRHLKKKYCSITLVCGTNDTATKKTPQDIHDNCKTLLDQAKGKANTVKLSSIPPRLDDKADSSKIETTN